jgi:small subunit ribosomal protein S16
MLAIRMQRTGRKGHAQFRVIVQDSHFHPTRGRVVAYLGSYNPHSKATTLDKELAAKYLGNGAQPSDRVAKLLQSEGIKLPDWVKVSQPKQRTIRNPEKLRRNRPQEEAVPEAEAPAAEAPEAAEESAATEESVPAAEESAKAESPAEQ